MANTIAALVRLHIPCDGHGGGPAETRALRRRDVDPTAFGRGGETLKPDDCGTAIPVIVSVYDAGRLHWSSTRPGAACGTSRRRWTDRP